MTRTEKRQIRYATVRNATGNVALARELRDRSDAYIFENFGIKIPSKLPKLRKLPSKQQRAVKLREIRKYQYARSKGIDPKTAYDLRKSTFKEIENRSRYITPTEKPKAVKKRDERRERIEKWRTMSSKGNEYSDDIIDMAERANRLKGFDSNASYGYTVAFYAYIENEPLEDWIKKIESDRFTETAVYKVIGG